MRLKGRLNEGVVLIGAVRGQKVAMTPLWLFTRPLSLMPL